ncbi:MAG: M42 family peptidase [Lachnospiraceae bacterium]|nr:M42 family peptidase [Lachnospiraceae bacterium]
MTEHELQCIEALSRAKAPSGFEEETLAVVRENLEDICDIREDSLRNLYLYPHSNTGDKPVLMLDAHGDEVGFMIHSIRPEGTLRFVPLGGWNKSTLPGTQVLVRNREGAWIPGVIAAKPPHFMTAEEKAKAAAADYKALVIDIGATSPEEAVQDFSIRIGEPAVVHVHFSYDSSRDLLQGKAFDCRIGCAALVETMRRLSGLDLAVDLVGVISSQEEVGERGCAVAVERVNPDIAIVFEGCPADDTFGEAYARQTRLNHGPMLRFMDVSVICNPRFQRFALDLAERKGLPVQASVREGGGNNAAVIQQKMKGSPSIVVGIPVRYIHTPSGIAKGSDYEAAIQLAVETVKNLTPEIIQSF